MSQKKNYVESIVKDYTGQYVTMQDHTEHYVAMQDCTRQYVTMQDNM